MKRNWKMIPRDGKQPQWAGIYVTINKKGTIVMNREAHERLSKCAAFNIYFDEVNSTIGLKPTPPGSRHAYPLLKSGKHGGRKVSAYRLLVESGMRVDETLEFTDADIDENGILTLRLRSAKVSSRAINHYSRRKPDDADPAPEA